MLMVDISSQNNKINVTVSSSGNTANTNVTPDYAQYYSEKSKEWATSNKIVDNTDYSSKYYANESKKQAVLATEQATIATNKTSEVVESGNTALNNIDNAKSEALTEIETLHSSSVTDITNLKNTSVSGITTAKDNAIISITNQETTSKTSLIDEGATQVGLIQNEGATQIANVQSTGFYMRDDKLYYINSQGEETEFKLDDIELNNPSFFGDSKYVPTKVNNLSWLKSEGQNNPKGTYPSFYDWILENVNKGVRGFLGQTMYMFGSATGGYYCSTQTPQVGAVLYSSANNDTSINATVTKVYDNGNIDISDLTPGISYTNVGRYPASDKSSADYITDYDFVLNTTDETFRLPLKNYTADDGNDKLTLYFYVGETVQNANLIDAGRIGEQLANKVDLDAQNLSAEGKSLISGLGMPSDKYIDLTLGKTNTNYTAPANGWFSINKLSSGTNQYVDLTNTTNGINVQVRGPANGAACRCYVPAKKGDIVNCTYSAGGTTSHFRFIYAQGEV